MKLYLVKYRNPGTNTQEIQDTETINLRIIRIEARRRKVPRERQETFSIQPQKNSSLT